MIVIPDYRGFRIQVDAIAVDGSYNAEVRIRRLFSQDKPDVDTVTCLKITPDLAEHNGEIWALAGREAAAQLLRQMGRGQASTPNLSVRWGGVVECDGSAVPDVPLGARS